MEKRILQVFLTIITLIIGFYLGLMIGKKIFNINKIEQKKVTTTADNANIEIIKSSDETNSINTDKKEIPQNLQKETKKILTKEEIREKKEIDSFVCPKPDKKYDDMSYFAVGQNQSLPDITYTPKDLREIDDVSSTKSGICLIKEARDSFESLAKKALEDGYRIKVSSGFRNYETQKNILDNEINNGNPNASIAVAKAGYSEHQ